MSLIADLAGAVRRREVSATATVQRALDAAEASQVALNGFTFVDREGALARAARIDASIAAGETGGPLSGVPIALKDLIDQSGIPTTNGSAFSAVVPDVSATVVERLEAAGAVVIGRTGLHEFAFGFTSENPHFGPVRNPWDVTLSPGGSSGGSAAVVAAGIVPAAIGTDTGGSVRVPAALCGVIGLKVTHGRVPLTGVTPLAPSLDTVGPIARTVGDVAAVYAAIAGDDPARSVVGAQDRRSGWRTLRCIDRAGRRSQAVDAGTHRSDHAATPFMKRLSDSSTPEPRSRRSTRPDSRSPRQPPSRRRGRSTGSTGTDGKAIRSDMAATLPPAQQG